MNTPDSPLEKKDLKIEKELTLDERVARLEHTLENAFNYLNQGLTEVEMRMTSESKDLQTQLSKTLTLMNMGTLQNIITVRELLRNLIQKEVIEPKAFEAQVNAELTKAIEAQQKAILADVEAAPEAEQSA